MSEIANSLNHRCVGCKAAGLCLDTMVADMNVLRDSAEELEAILSLTPRDEVPGPRAGLAPEYVDVLALMVVNGSALVECDANTLMQATDACPGKQPSGECGQSPQEQLAMLPDSVNSADPRFQEIAAAVAVQADAPAGL